MDRRTEIQRTDSRNVEVCVYFVRWTALAAAETGSLLASKESVRNTN